MASHLLIGSSWRESVFSCKRFIHQLRQVNANGQSYPLGVWGANYAASLAANAMVAILIEEVFGFNTTEGMGAGTVDGYYGVTPCSDPTNIADRGCDDDGVPGRVMH